MTVVQRANSGSLSIKGTMKLIITFMCGIFSLLHLSFQQTFQNQGDPHVLIHGRGLLDAERTMSMAMSLNQQLQRALEQQQAALAASEAQQKQHLQEMKQIKSELYQGMLPQHSFDILSDASKALEGQAGKQGEAIKLLTKEVQDLINKLTQREQKEMRERDLPTTISAQEEEALDITDTHNPSITTATEPRQKNATGMETYQEKMPQKLSAASEETALPTKNPLSKEQVIFYHMFINPEDPSNAIRIIEEQLGQVGNSTAEADGSTVYYTAIGAKQPPSFMNRVCLENKLKCHPLKHHKEGNEALTLQALKDFCAHNEELQVTYMHNKGSFHFNEQNEHWRKSMTTAVTSKECQTGIQDHACSACGLVFETDRFPFFPGNFFTAQCSYVNQLLDLPNYQEQTSAFAKHALFLQTEGKMIFSLMDQSKPENLGIHRYAAEAWIGSHPTLQPCHVSAKHGIKHYWKNTATEANLRLGFGPRTSVEKGYKKKQISKKLNDRKREYFLLPGLVLKWYYLYDMAPAQDSWFWNYFPDGRMWKNAIKQHGRDAFDEITKEFKNV